MRVSTDQMLHSFELEWKWFKMWNYKKEQDLRIWE